MYSCSKPLRMVKIRKTFLCLCSDIVINRISNFRRFLSLNSPPVSHSLESINSKIRLLYESELSPFLSEDFEKQLKLFSKTDHKRKYEFVVDQLVGSDIVKNIFKFSKLDGTIAEVNPGLGLITFYLLKCNLAKIHIYDQSSLKKLCLDQLHKKFPKQIEVTSLDILSRHTLNKSKTALINLLDKGPNLTIIGVLPNTTLINRMLHIAIGSWNSLTGIEIYSVVGHNVANRFLTCGAGSSFYTYCLFNLFFDAVVIASYPAEAFLPLSTDSTPKLLLKIKPKQNPFENIQEKDLEEYCFFIRTIGRSRFNFVLPTLERWVPGCGPFLISKGISLTLQACDLTHSESVLLFKLLKNYDSNHTFETFCNSEMGK